MAKRDFLDKNALERFNNLTPEDQHKAMETLKQNLKVKELPQQKTNSDEQPDENLIV